MNNFGDLLGPLLVHRILGQFGIRDESTEHRRLVAVGSIMKLTQPGDVVWGAGVNGRSMSTGAAPHLDVRAVRGPRTRDLLLEAGTEVPEVYGDPALLWSYFWPHDRYLSENPFDKLSPVTVVPNYHDVRRVRGAKVVNPLGDPYEVIQQIALSKFVCGSSLHGIVIAESFGIPARLIRSASEPSFKYDDYYAGTGRPNYQPAESVADAIRLGGEPPADFDPSRLLDAFPVDMWGGLR